MNAAQPWSPSLVQYGKVLGTPAFLRLLGVSALVALGIAMAATMLAYPLAYFLAFRARTGATLFLALLLAPFAASYLLRIMAWKLVLGPAGAVNSLLSAAGPIGEPLDLLLYSRRAVAPAVFLVGGEPTFPVMLYGRLRFGGQLPELIAMAVLLMLAAVGLTLLALRLRRSPA